MWQFTVVLFVTAFNDNCIGIMSTVQAYAVRLSEGEETDQGHTASKRQK